MAKNSWRLFLEQKEWINFLKDLNLKRSRKKWEEEEDGEKQNQFISEQDVFPVKQIIFKFLSEKIKAEPYYFAA